MGIVVDTSVIARCERKGWTSLNTLQFLATFAQGDFVIPAIVATELIVGVYRAPTTELSVWRRQFVSDLFKVLEVIPFTVDTAWVAGELRATHLAQGTVLPFADSLIAAYALQRDDAILTENVKDFDRIRNLRVMQFSAP